MALRVTDDGASGRAGVSGSHPFGWRDAMDLLVKWRQLAEPNDQVSEDSRLFVADRGPLPGICQALGVTYCRLDLLPEGEAKYVLGVTAPLRDS